MASFLQTGENEWTVAIRGAHLTLVRQNQPWAKWAVLTDNAAARAWNHGRESFRGFQTLAEVEAHYKSWRGISAFIGEQA